MTSWQDLRERLRIVFSRRGKHGAEELADKIPVDRSTLYRLLNETHKRPQRAVHAGIERLIERQNEEKNDGA